MNYRDLPVYCQKEKILTALEKNQVIVVESPTGSGKTTQLPVILDEAGYTKTGVIGVTQPRRIATLSVSDFISSQLGISVGDYIGYKMRFADKTSKNTRLKIMTDGILLQEIKHDPLLMAYQVLIIDEAHERSLNIDFILGLIKNILRERPDFKVIVSSATMNSEVFSTYFDSCPVIHIETEMFPVELVYSASPENEEELVYTISGIVHRLLNNKHKGDILIFLSGEKIIKECMNAIMMLPDRSKIKLLPLYGRLSKEEQEQVFVPAPEGVTKIIVATNIAETSVTIDGITAVIDSGLGKINYYSPRTFTSSLREQPVSKASCEQRKGRAGRTQPGVCYRLYTKDDFDSRTMYTLEEIYRTDLSEVVLRMAELGVTDYYSFNFISPPGKEGIIGAVETLKILGALDGNNVITNIGKQMFPYPLLPLHSRIIIEGILKFPDILSELTVIVSFLSTHTPYLLPMGEEFEARKAHHAFKDKYGDFIAYLKLMTAYKDKKKKDKFCENYYLDTKTMSEIHNINEQLLEIISEAGIPVHEDKKLDYPKISRILKAVSCGLIQYICVKTDRYSYKSLTADRIQIHPGSVLFRESPEFIVAGEIVKTSKIFARSVSMLEKKWLNDINPDIFNTLTRKHGRSAGDRKKRDTTWNISIGDYEVKLIPYKGKKKLAVLDWNRLKKNIHNIRYNQYSMYSKVRAVLRMNGREIIKYDKLFRTLQFLKTFDPEKNIISSLPKKNFSIYKNPEQLGNAIDSVFKICLFNKKNFGFSALETDYKGNYWFKVYGNYLNALETSLASIDKLIDETPEHLPSDFPRNIGIVFRKLTSVYDNLFLE